ncbi:MAG: hydantoinase/oxoprolinase family protein [Rhodospirillales bacterium]|nr:hydantoinase/oxoprolinase family protein [Rhodospirillales bacterium]
MSYTLGIDVGGTFTDVVLASEDGRIVTAKAASTPADQSDGVLAGIAAAAARIGLSPTALLGAATRIVHGTTVATNALLEGRTAPLAMLTTAGHRDVIEMREGLKPERYHLRMSPPAPLVARHRRIAVAERMGADGRARIPLGEAAIAEALEAIARARAEGVRAVAVCFLHAWANPAHEAATAGALRAHFPDLYVCASAEVLGQIKEFERFSTTIANAAVGPVIGAYLGRLSARLTEAGFAGALFITLSHGGVASAAEAVRLAAATALSGPAGLLTFDMGGTSSDIALLRDGQAELADGRMVGPARIALPALDIVTLGAGGGSVAVRDKSGLLAVGPASAGAQPGPACYGQGGLAATVTDADLVLGLLDPARFLGGARRLDRAAAEAALARLGVALGLRAAASDTALALAAASGVQRLVDARMADGVRIATVRRGHDPRFYTLLAFGGAAGLHVSAVAAMLGIARVAVPRAASVLSAWGMLNSALRVELVESLPQRPGVGADIPALRAAFAAMEQAGRARLPVADAPVTLRRAADLRYGEQVFELTVALDGLDFSQPDAVLAAALAETFHAAHQARYTYAQPDQEVVLVHARLTVAAALAGTAASPGEAAAIPAAAFAARRCFLDGAWQDVPVFDFAALAAGQAIAGPAIIEQADTTILLRNGDLSRYDGRGWLEIVIGV